MLVTKNANRPVTWCTLNSVSSHYKICTPVSLFFFVLQMPFHKLETCSAVPNFALFDSGPHAKRIACGNVKKIHRSKDDFINVTGLEIQLYLRKLQRFSWQSMPLKENALVENSRWARKKFWCKGFQMEGTIDSSWIASLYSMQKKVCCLQLVA